MLPLVTSEILQAVGALELAVKGVNLHTKVPKEELLASVGLASGLSSESPRLCVFVDGKWQKMRTENKTKAPLDRIGSHSLDMTKVTQAAESMDPPLKEMLDTFCNGVVKPSIAPKLLGASRKLSKDFSRKDLKMLVRAKILSRRSARSSLLGFKVKKKDPRFSRFVTDCRPFNKKFSAFTDEKMNLPKQHTIMDWGVKYPIIQSVDAKAYFYQFALKGPSSRWFPMSFSVDNEEMSFAMNRLPMGCNLAPIIAQRVSNIIIDRTRWHLRKRGIPGEVVAWVDNFLMFANDKASAAEIEKILLGQLRYFNVLCSPMDTSGDFLGLEKAPSGGLRLSSKFRASIREQIKKVQEEGVMEKKQTEILCGKLMWLNYTVERSPLAVFPHTLEIMRSLPRASSATTFTISEGFREELNRWESSIDKPFMGTADAQNTPEVWTDATPTRIAVVMGRAVFMAEMYHAVDIALAEAIAAAWGLILSNNKAHLFIDNLGVAHAFAKGHSTSHSINQVIRNVFSMDKPTDGSITWVPTEDQIADGPTRGLPPKFTASASGRWKVIPSMIFAQARTPRDWI